MATTEFQDIAIDRPELSTPIRSYFRRNASRKKVLKMLQRLHEAEADRKGSSVEPVHLTIDSRVWTERINRLWPI
jgi:hypothetical protein